MVAQPPAQQAVPPVPDIAALLKIINGQQQSQPSQQYQQPASQPQSNGLEAIFAQFANNNTQVPQLQLPQQPPQPSTSGFDLQATLAAMTQHGPAQPGYGMVPPQPQGVDLQAILAQFGKPPTPQMQGYGYQNSFQGQNDRKRPVDYDDQNGDYGYSNGKRQKNAAEKKKVRFDGIVLQAHSANPCFLIVLWRTSFTLQVLPRRKVQKGR